MSPSLPIAWEISIVGARVLHIIDVWDFYQDNPERIFYVWQGGVTIYGAILGGFAGGALYISTRNSAWFLSLWGRYFKFLGEAKEAQKIFRELEARSGIDHISPVEWALGYLAIGDQEQALDWLVQASESHYPENWTDVEFDIATNAFADPVLDQPEFAEARSRLGFRGDD